MAHVFNILELSIWPAVFTGRKDRVVDKGPCCSCCSGFQRAQYVAQMAQRYKGLQQRHRTSQASSLLRREPIRISVLAKSWASQLSKTEHHVLNSVFCLVICTLYLLLWHLLPFEHVLVLQCCTFEHKRNHTATIVNRLPRAAFHSTCFCPAWHYASPNLNLKIHWLCIIRGCKLLNRRCLRSNSFSCSCNFKIERQTCSEQRG